MSRPGWVAGARGIARPRSSAGSRSSWRRSRSERPSACRRSTRTIPTSARRAGRITSSATAGSRSTSSPSTSSCSRRLQTASDPAFRAVVADAIAPLERFPQVTKLRSPLAPGNEGQISTDGHSALIQFTPEGSYDDAVTYIDSITAATDAVQKANPDYYVGEAGLGVDRQGARRDVQLAARARRAHLDPDHARHPAARVRLARRRRRSRSCSRSRPCSRPWGSWR